MLYWFLVMVFSPIVAQNMVQAAPVRKRVQMVVTAEGSIHELSGNPSKSTQDDLTPKSVRIHANQSASSMVETNQQPPCNSSLVEGWSYGDWNVELEPSEAPDGDKWTWYQCAARCAEEPEEICTFWTLQENEPNHCFLLTNKASASFNSDMTHFEGDRNLACLTDSPTPTPTSKPTALPTQVNIAGYKITYESSSSMNGYKAAVTELEFMKNGVRTIPIFISSLTKDGCTVTQPNHCDIANYDNQILQTLPWDGNFSGMSCWNFGPEHSILCDHDITSDSIHMTFQSADWAAQDGFTIEALDINGASLGAVYTKSTNDADDPDSTLSLTQPSSLAAKVAKHSSSSAVGKAASNAESL